VRVLNRWELVTQTLRHARTVLAEAAPAWRRGQVTDEWFDRYSRRVDAYHLPKGQAARQAYAALIGADGAQLLAAIDADPALVELRRLPAVMLLRQVWEQHYRAKDGQLRWRKAVALPPAGERLDSPDDPEARFGSKRSMTWTGDNVHLTETGEEDAPHLSTHVETTKATIPDVTMTEPIHQALSARCLAPAEPLVDAG
jgi:transposase